MIFFKEKTVMLGRCNADMQEHLCKEIIKKLQQQWPLHIKYVDGMIRFYDKSSIFVKQYNFHPLKSVRYGEIHFLPKDNEIEIVTKLRPSGIHIWNLICIPLVIIFCCLWLLFGINEYNWMGLVIILLMLVTIAYSARSDVYLKKSVQEIITKNHSKDASQ